jgi:hypothetical protein
VLLRRGGGHRHAQVEVLLPGLAVDAQLGGRGALGRRAHHGHQVVPLDQRPHRERRHAAPLAGVEVEVGDRCHLAGVGELDGEAAGGGR